MSNEAETPQKKYRLEPLGDRAIIDPDSAETMTASGIIIPDTAKERPQVGTIIDLGDGRNQDNEILHYVLQVREAAKILLSNTIKPGVLEMTEFANGAVDYKPRKLEKGMRVLYGRYAGTEITFNGNKHLIMRFSDIIGILHEE